MKKYLLQELKDLEKYKDCLTRAHYKTYKNHLYEQTLKEFDIEYLNDVFGNKNNKKETPQQRMEKIVNQLKNTKYCTIKRNPKTNKIERVKTFRTNLQTSDEKFCSKKSFVDEFLSQEFTDSKEAKRLLKQFTDLFDDEGWLILD